MTRRHIGCSRSLLAALVLLTLPVTAGAQNTLSFGDFDITPGATDVAVPIELSSAVALTQLAFDFVYEPATDLCSALVDPGAISIVRAGRLTANPQEVTVTCTDGRIRIVVFDLGGTPIIPVGSGPVFEVVLGDVSPTAAGSVGFSLQDIVANATPLPVAVDTPHPAEDPLIKDFGVLPTTSTVVTSTTTSTTETTSTTTTTEPTTTSTTTTTTSTTSTLATTTTTEPTTTTTTATSTTSTSVPGAATLAFTTTAGTSDCGPAGLTQDAAAPLSGEITTDTACSANLRDLGLGCLYFGGGNGTVVPPGRIPDGATSIFEVSGTPPAVSLVASGGTSQNDCTQGAGPARHCVNNNSLPACTTDTDCGGAAGSCALDANCFFGPPLPIPSPPPFVSLTTCVLNVIQSDGSGTADTSDGSSTVTLPLSSRVYITGNFASPCPKCVANACTYGKDAGETCTPVGSLETTNECQPSFNGFQAPLAVTLSPLTTGTASLTAADGNFCPGQSPDSATGKPGAFGHPTAQCIEETGTPAGPLSPDTPTPAVLASVFCIPPTGNVAVDGVADLPGPGAIGLAGNVVVQGIVGGTTTTTTTEPTTSTTTSSTTTTTETTTTTLETTTTTTVTTSTTTTTIPFCGNGVLEGLEQCDPPGSVVCPPTLPGGDDVACEPDCSCAGVTALTEPATAGASVLEVASELGFDEGDLIRINPGGENEEDNMVAGFGSLLLGMPLAFDHAAGEPVVELPPGPPTTTTTTTSSTTTTTGGLCGNGRLDPGEQCDPPWSRNAEQCPPLPGRQFGPECGDDCQCVTTTTTTSSSSSTTTTTLGLCGNGRLDPGEECDPPWSRNPLQCPPLPGRQFGPECGDDCRCLTTTTSTATTSSTTSTAPTTSTSTTSTSSTSTTESSSTTTASTSSSTTTTAPRAEIQCCVSGSPEPAFPDGITCEFLKPAECVEVGGEDMGPGTCDPNPCLPASTTTTTQPLGDELACARSATMSSVACRLGELIGMVAEAGDMHDLGARLLAPLQRAEARMHRAEQLAAAGRPKRARAFLRRAARDLRIFNNRLRSRRAVRLLAPGARQLLLGVGEPLRLDLQALVPPAGR